MAVVLNIPQHANAPVFGPLLRPRRIPNSMTSLSVRASSSADSPDASSSIAAKEGSVATFAPAPPPGFKPPEPNWFSVRPDKLFDVLGASLSLVFRLGTGVFVSGLFLSLSEADVDHHRMNLEKGIRVKETSKIGPRPEKPIEIYEFESCPFYRKVTEIVSILDLDVVFYPCPRNGPNFRPKVAEMGGKNQFPYMVMDEFLFCCPLAPFHGFAMIGRIGKGTSCVPSKLPLKTLELWAYVVSPFCKLMREVLVELELPHLVRSCTCGSLKRNILYQKAGRFQVPYLDDPNTGANVRKCLGRGIS